MTDRYVIWVVAMQAWDAGGINITQDLTHAQRYTLADALAQVDGMHRERVIMLPLNQQD